MLTAVETPGLAAAFYREFYPKLYRFVFARTGAAHGDVDDIVQETLLDAWRCRGDFLVRSAPETWIFSIAKNKVADFWRARRRSERRDAAGVREAVARIADAPIADDVLDTVEMRERVGRAMERLDEAYAQVLLLRYLEGMTVRAIAGRLGESESTVESRLTRARDAFRQLLGGPDE